jgi:hypothetical protein
MHRKMISSSRDAVLAQGKVFVPASLSTLGGFGPIFLMLTN